MLIIVKLKNVHDFHEKFHNYDFIFIKKLIAICRKMVSKISVKGWEKVRKLFSDFWWEPWGEQIFFRIPTVSSSLLSGHPLNGCNPNPYPKTCIPAIGNV